MKWLCLAIAFTTVCVVDRARGQSNDPSVVQAEQQAFREALAVIEPSVVQIQTVGGADRVGELFVGTGPTTGLIVSEDGFIVTSAFGFASKPSSVLVSLGDGRSFPAETVATDHLRKLTLLKIDGKGLTTSEMVPLEELRAGHWSIAVGRTYQALVPNVSIGIISALERVWGKAIQTDAKISPVNYGGPLINIEGRVQGILVPMNVDDESATAGVEIYDSGIGFAVPMADVLASVERMKSGKDLKQGLMGVQFQAAGFQGRPLVGKVREGSPAQQAGLKAGDVVLAANGAAVARVADFKQIVGRMYGGDELRLEIKRGAEELELRCQLVEELAPYVRPSLGIVPERSIAAGKTTESQGVKVRAILEGSAAAKAGLKAGDVVVKLASKEVNSSATLARELVGASVGESVDVEIVRDGQNVKSSVVLDAMSAMVPAKLAGVSVPAAEEAEQAMRTGLIRKTLTGYEREYWAYVPEGFAKDFPFGVVMWLHPEGAPMQEELLTRWSSVCNQRGLILLAPLAEEGLGGWTSDDLIFMGDCLGDLEKTYRINEELMALHLHAKTTRAGMEFLALNSVLFTGVILLDNTTALAKMVNSPDRKLMFLLVSTTDDEVSVRSDQESARGLRDGKIPVETVVGVYDKNVYPDATLVEMMGRWVDALNRL